MKKITFVLLFPCLIIGPIIFLEIDSRREKQAFEKFRKEIAVDELTIKKLHKKLEDIEQDAQALKHNRFLFLKKLKEKIEKKRDTTSLAFFISYFSLFHIRMCRIRYCDFFACSAAKALATRG